MKHFSTKTLLAGTAALCVAGFAKADQVILDDLIVDGSACIGLDCVNGESFGFDTLRLKENNLRIKFQDTSSSASFPSNDWQITANQSSNGGSNLFGIDDIDGGRTILTLYAGAPGNSLVVDSQGDVGLGVAAPVVELHVRDGDTPTMRLEQDGSSGFTPQTWDVAGNETNFFVRDVTNGSQLPFKIRPGADSNSLVIDAENDIGIGVGTDARAKLHISNGGTVQAAPNAGDDVIIQDDGPVRVAMINTSPSTGTNQIWTWTNNDTLRLSAGTDSPEFVLTEDGDLTIEGGLITTDGGGACTVADPCDAVFDPDVYTVPSIEEHAAKMWSDKHLPAVGPTGPGIPINMTEKMLRMLNELEHAHIYIEQLNDRIKVLEAEIDKS